jgi:carbon-monoxide dehydrogenase medium subunit
MKPAAFDYVRPHDVDELLGTFADGDVLLAGGQSLLPQLNERRCRPRRLIDLNAIAELRRCEIGPDHVVLGALTRHRDLADNADVRAALPVLSQAAEHVGHAAIRTRGTLGGTIANADPAAELPGVCVLLDASAQLQSPTGDRTAAVAELLRPGGLRAREVIVAIELPRLVRGEGWGFRELSRPGAYAFPLVTVAATLRLAADGTVSALRAVVTGAASAPYTLGDAAIPRLGQPPVDDWVDAVAARLEAAADPVDDLHASASYRRRIVRHLARDVLADARLRAVAGVAA